MNVCPARDVHALRAAQAVLSGGQQFRGQNLGGGFCHTLTGWYIYLSYCSPQNRSIVLWHRAMEAGEQWTLSHTRQLTGALASQPISYGNELHGCTTRPRLHCKHRCCEYLGQVLATELLKKDAGRGPGLPCETLKRWLLDSSAALEGILCTAKGVAQAAAHRKVSVNYQAHTEGKLRRGPPSGHPGRPRPDLGPMVRNLALALRGCGDPAAAAEGGMPAPSWVGQARVRSCCQEVDSAGRRVCGASRGERQTRPIRPAVPVSCLYDYGTSAFAMNFCRMLPLLVIEQRTPKKHCRTTP